MLRLYPTKSGAYSIKFLMEMIDSFGEIGFEIQRIQSDCGSEFYAEEFQLELMEHFIKFRPNSPGKPHLNGKVERGQKTDKEEFYATLNLKDRTLDLAAELSKWERFYHYERPHSALGGKTPHEPFLELQKDVPVPAEIHLKWYEGKEEVKTIAWEKYKKQNPEILKKMLQMS